LGHAPGEGLEVGARARAEAPAAAAPTVVALAVAAGGFFVGGIGKAAEGAVALAYDAPAVPAVEHMRMVRSVSALRARRIRASPSGGGEEEKEEEEEEEEARMAEAMARCFRHWRTRSSPSWTAL